MVAMRFAPSPTGQLHLGHAYSALVAHDLARDLGGRFLLRIDDIDGGRCQPKFAQAIVDDLDWLGLTPDTPPVFQSQRTARYDAALQKLIGIGLAYPCFCSRAQIAAEVAASAAAPHGAVATHYPGTCRTLDPSQRLDRISAGHPHCWRLDMASALARGRMRCKIDVVRQNIWGDPSGHGDIVLARRDAASAYHLASTVDDAAMGISHVVRGNDLVHATTIHLLLQALLDLPTPDYVHHRLVGNPHGVRLAKRHNAATLVAMRDTGVDPLELVDNLRCQRLPLGFAWVSV